MFSGVQLLEPPSSLDPELVELSEELLLEDDELEEELEDDELEDDEIGLYEEEELLLELEENVSHWPSR